MFWLHPPYPLRFYESVWFVCRLVLWRTCDPKDQINYLLCITATCWDKSWKWQSLHINFAYQMMKYGFTTIFTPDPRLESRISTFKDFSFTVWLIYRLQTKTKEKYCVPNVTFVASSCGEKVVCLTAFIRTNFDLQKYLDAWISE